MSYMTDRELKLRYMKTQLSMTKMIFLQNVGVIANGELLLECDRLLEIIENKISEEKGG